MKKIDKSLVKGIANNIGIEMVGVTDPYYDEDLCKLLKQRFEKYPMTEFESDDLKQRSTPSDFLQGAKSVIVFAFPYYRQENNNDREKNANLSVYCRPKDYHLIINSYLDKFIEILKKYGEFTYKKFSDTTNIVDRYLAYKAGLGFFGKNNQLINIDYGTYFFIGGLITSLELSYDRPLNVSCYNCGKCIKACPGQALKENYFMDPRACLSYISQKKGDLSKLEFTKLKKLGMVFGCDVCQRVCPHNLEVDRNPLKEFNDNLIYMLDIEELESMSNKDFKKKYYDRAFAWRGKKILIRNLRTID